MSGVPLGSLVVRYSGTFATYSFANVRPQPVRYRRELFRAPFGTTWFTAGDGVQQPERFLVTVEVSDEDGPVESAVVAAELEDRLAACTRIEAHVGVFDVVACERITRTVIPGGFRVEALLASARGLKLGIAYVMATPETPSTFDSTHVALLEDLGYVVTVFSGDELPNAADLYRYQAIVLGAGGLAEEAAWSAVANVNVLFLYAPMANNLGWAVTDTAPFTSFTTLDVLPSAVGHPLVGGASAGPVVLYTTAYQTPSYTLGNIDASEEAYPMLSRGSPASAYYLVHYESIEGVRYVTFPASGASANPYTEDGAALFAAAVAWVTDMTLAFTPGVTQSYAGSTEGYAGDSTTFAGGEPT